MQLPDLKVEEAPPTYIKSDSMVNDSSKNETVTESTTAEVSTETTTPKTEVALPNVKPIDTSVKTLNLTQTSAKPDQKIETNQKTLPIETEEKPLLKTNTEPKTDTPTNLSATLKIMPSVSEMKRGEKIKIPVMVSSSAAFRSAVLGLTYDASKIAVRTVGYGDVFGREMAQTPLTPYVNQGGKTYVSLSTDKDILPNSSGILAYIEIEALTDGKPEINFDTDMLNIMSVDGKIFSLKY